jgi:hypothetical protein
VIGRGPLAISNVPLALSVLGVRAGHARVRARVVPLPEPHARARGAHQHHQHE